MAFLAGAVLLWGTSFAVTKAAYSALPAMYVAWFRMLVATVAFLPLLRFVRRPTYVAGDWKLIALALSFIPCAYFAFEGFAITFTTSSQAGVITAMLPLVVAVIAWMGWKEKPNRRTTVGIVASVVGVVVLSLASASQVAAPNPMLGNTLELGAMLAAAGSTLTVKRLSVRYDPLLLTGLQMAAGSVFFAPLALTTGKVDLTAVPTQAWLAVAYLGVGCGLAAFGLFNAALRWLSASRVALGANVIPVVALATGWLALGETMSLVQGAACAVILGSVVYAQYSPKQTTSAAA